MKRFILEETQACWVTWTYEIDAETEEEARRKLSEGDSCQVGGPDIGDCLDRESEITVEEVER
jgi:hypothetical protein